VAARRCSGKIHCNPARPAPAERRAGSPLAGSRAARVLTEARSIAAP
jgi:hypothetical protein